MKIKQTYLNKDEKVIDIDHDAIEILDDDGNELFSIHQRPSGDIQVSSNTRIKRGDIILDCSILIEPVSANVVMVRRREVKK